MFHNYFTIKVMRLLYFFKDLFLCKATPIITGNYEPSESCVVIVALPTNPFTVHRMNFHYTLSDGLVLDTVPVAILLRAVWPYSVVSCRIRLQ